MTAIPVSFDADRLNTATNPVTVSGSAPPVAGQTLVAISSTEARWSTGSLPTPTQAGEVLYAVDGSSFVVAVPLTGDAGWLVNDDGLLLVAG